MTKDELKAAAEQIAEYRLIDDAKSDSDRAILVCRDYLRLLAEYDELIAACGTKGT